MVTKVSTVLLSGTYLNLHIVSSRRLPSMVDARAECTSARIASESRCVENDLARASGESNACLAGDMFGSNYVSPRGMRVLKHHH